MIAEQVPFWNHERHFRPLDRTFDNQMTFGTLFRWDSSSFGHTCPFVILLFSPFVDQRASLAPYRLSNVTLVTVKLLPRDQSWTFSDRGSLVDAELGATRGADPHT